MRTTNSSIGRAVKFLMSQEPRMKKDKQSEYSETIMANIKDGELFMLTQLKTPPRDSTKNSDSMPADLSISDQEIYSEELLNASISIICSLPEDTERMILTNNSTSMEYPRPSRMSKKDTQSQSPKTDLTTMSDAKLPTQDGGKCGNVMALSSEMLKTTRFLISPEMKIVNNATSKITQKMVNLVNNGRSSTLMNGRMTL
jgi:hypothetical protein